MNFLSILRLSLHSASLYKMGANASHLKQITLLNCPRWRKSFYFNRHKIKGSTGGFPFLLNQTVTNALHKMLNKTYIVYFQSSPPTHTHKGLLCCLVMERGGCSWEGWAKKIGRVCQMQGHPMYQGHPICPVKASRHLYWTAAYRKMQDVDDHFSDNGKALNHAAQTKTMVSHSYIFN